MDKDREDPLILMSTVLYQCFKCKTSHFINELMRQYFQISMLGSKVTTSDATEPLPFLLMFRDSSIHLIVRFV